MWLQIGLLRAKIFDASKTKTIQFVMFNDVYKMTVYYGGAKGTNL